MLHFHWLRSLREYTVVQVTTGALGGLRVPGGALGKAKAVADGSLGKWALACAMSKSLGCTPWCTPLLLLSWFGSALVLAAFASGGLPGVRCGSRACHCVRRLARRDVPFDRPRSKTIQADTMPTAQHQY